MNPSYHAPMIVSQTWLQIHNPHINWNAAKGWRVVVPIVIPPV